VEGRHGGMARVSCYTIVRNEELLIAKHYVDQLFYESRGTANERGLCESRFDASDLDVGRAIIDAYYH